MRFSNFGNTIFGINITGQGINGVVEGTHVVVLRHLVSRIVRRLSLRLASWHALTCTPAAMTPAMAMCPSYSGRCQKRDERSGVVTTRGTVGVC